MIIASIVFFVVPSILIGALLKTGYGSVIGIPFPLIVLFIGLYVLWRVNANRKARKRFDEMAAAAQPLTGDREFRPPAQVGVAETLPVTPLDNIAQIANPAQSENEKEKNNKTAEEYQIDNESERKMEEQ